jgi:protease-4
MAQGRVWSGVKALELGLVDKLGGLNESLAAAARAVNITDYEVLELVRPLSLSEKILYQIGDVKVEFIKVFLPQKSNPWSIKEKLNELYAGLSILTELNDPRGIYLSCFECSK